MKISFVIPAYNEEHFLRDCLLSVMRECEGFAEEAQTEIIVVNNASKDKTCEVALEFPQVRLIDESRQGVNFARSRGFEATTGEWVAFLDADVRLPSGWMARAMRFFETHPKVVALSGPYEYYDATSLGKTLMNILWRVTVPFYWVIGYMANGGNLIVRRSALEKIGGINTKVLFYGDDTDVARRLSTVGKVAFRMNFFAYSSYRRYERYGLLKTLFLYVMNFFWEVLFEKPFTRQV